MSQLCRKCGNKIPKDRKGSEQVCSKCLPTNPKEELLKEITKMLPKNQCPECETPYTACNCGHYNNAYADSADRLVEKIATVEEIIEILSNPHYWCPSKTEQWRRMAQALTDKYIILKRGEK